MPDTSTAPTLDAFSAAIVDWLTSAAGISGKVLRADEPRPRQLVPAMTAKVIAWTPLGEPERIEGDSAGTTIVQEFGGTLSVQGYGHAAWTWLTTAIVLLGDEETMRLLGAAGLEITDAAGLTDISALEGTAIERRYLVEFSIASRIEVTPPVPARDVSTVILDEVRLQRTPIGEAATEPVILEGLTIFP